MQPACAVRLAPAAPTQEREVESAVTVELGVSAETWTAWQSDITPLNGADANADGVVDFDEFKKVMDTLAEKTGKRYNALQLRGLFRMADLDGSVRGTRARAASRPLSALSLSHTPY